jgi:SH3-like domain-containing protein
MLWPRRMRAMNPGTPIRRCSRRWLLGVVLLVASFAAAPEAWPQAGGPDNALRYVSLKADKVYLRKGPGTGYPIAKLYERAGLPVEVIREFDVWRQVRDASGTVGWVHSALLSGRRTALVLPWEMKAEGQGPPVQATLRDDSSAGARAVAQMEAGVLVDILGCDMGWCRVSLGDQRGYIEQAKLWGIYPNETIR